jgi:hypothetical protein
VATAAARTPVDRQTAITYLDAADARSVASAGERILSG